MVFLTVSPAPYVPGSPTFILKMREAKDIRKLSVSKNYWRT
jgi:hypothetical protein